MAKRAPPVPMYHMQNPNYNHIWTDWLKYENARKENYLPEHLIEILGPQAEINNKVIGTLKKKIRFI